MKQKKHVTFNMRPKRCASNNEPWQDVQYLATPNYAFSLWDGFSGSVLSALSVKFASFYFGVSPSFTRASCLFICLSSLSPFLLLYSHRSSCDSFSYSYSKSYYLYSGIYQLLFSSTVATNKTSLCLALPLPAATSFPHWKERQGFCVHLVLFGFSIKILPYR